jgi:hypothetical protein
MSALEIVDDGDRKILKGLASVVTAIAHTPTNTISAPSRFRFIAKPLFRREAASPQSTPPLLV